VPEASTSDPGKPALLAALGVSRAGTRAPGACGAAFGSSNGPRLTPHMAKPERIVKEPAVVLRNA
jgi:hypothetical protein